MKLILKVVLWTVCAYLGPMLATGFGIEAMLSGSRIQQLFSTLNQRVPATISARGGTFDLQQWFLFRPVVTLDGLSIANPPGFSAQPLLTAKQVGAQVALSSIFKKEFEIVRVSLTAPEVNIESAAKVYPDVAGMAKAQAVEKGMGLLDSFIKKRTAAQPK
jgi:hypothetical protein